MSSPVNVPNSARHCELQKHNNKKLRFFFNVVESIFYFHCWNMLQEMGVIE